MLDYGLFPPEITSARMYAGPGSAPMMTAAAAWRTLFAEVSSAAASYEDVLSQLAGEEWMGPASASMITAATPYVAWMKATAGQADQAATQAAAAAAAYETAHAAITPPAVVAANRAQHAALVATNFLGQNTPAIMANEAEYGAFWANNTATMYGYAGSSAAAARVAPFTEPNQTTNPAGTANQAAAVAQSGGTAAGNTTQTAQVISSLPGAIHSLSSPAATATSTASGSNWILKLEAWLGNNPLNGAMYLVGNPLYNFTNTMGTGAAFVPSSLLPSLIGYMTGGGFTGAGGGAVGSGLGAILGPGGALGALGGLGSGAAGGISSAFGVSSVSGGVTAGMGQASLVGSFSAPASWAAATPTSAASIAPVAAQPSGWVVPAESHSMAAMPPGIPAGTGRGAFSYGTPRYGVRPKIMPRPMVC